MANTINRAKCVATGPKRYLLYTTIIGDGSGEETATILNATTADIGTNSKILQVWASLTGFSAKIYEDANTDEYLFQLVNDQNINFDFNIFGGLQHSKPAGATGDILITTTGLGSGDCGTIIMDIATE